MKTSSKASKTSRASEKIETSNTVIDRKTDRHTFGHWPAKEEVATTITLVHMGSGKFGLSYDSVFSGVKSGHVSGGPYPVSGNMHKVLHNSPQVVLTISNFDETSTTISMRVTITVDIPVLGNKTIFDETLGGAYASGAGWDIALANVGAKLSD